jgi:2-polyprenyl-6-methoxyphenol hydroxylase-like FAD-dependent oxidoreductase
VSVPDFDVVIVGGGPAGCATALTLADAGISVALVDRPRQHDQRACETVPPGIRRPLERLGIWPRFARLNNFPHLASKATGGCASRAIAISCSIRSATGGISIARSSTSCWPRKPLREA